MTSTPTPTVELDSATDVLAYARTRRADADRAEADVFAAAATWAEQHPVESIRDASIWAEAVFAERPLALAGEGAPLIAEFCVPEFAAALGMSPDAGKCLLAHAVETKHRLPRLWARVQSGDLPTWRARRVAEATVTLSPEAAAFVDQQVAPFAHKVGVPTIDRLVTEAIARHMPDRAREEASKAADGRHVRFHHNATDLGGVTYMDAILDTADALDLDAAIIQGAEVLKAAGCDADLDVRRSMAAGELGRHQLALDLTNAMGDQPEDGWDAEARRKVKPRQVVLHVHLSEAALSGAAAPADDDDRLDVARLERGNRLFTADQVRTWCANPNTVVTVKPVVDLDGLTHVAAYEVPNRLAEQVRFRDHTCVFPWCTRPARRADCDHVVPFDADGPTCSCNLAALCRRHHRLKTHATWTYTVISPGTYLWSSPHGYQFLRDHTGTTDVTQDRPKRPPGRIHRT